MLIESVSTVAEAARVLRRLPVHMAYNILLLDRSGDFTTAYTRPDGSTILYRTPASTNHQDRIAWARHAAATATLERERRLFELLGNRQLSETGFTNAFLQPPLFQTNYHKGYGTLYTAIYRPAAGKVEYRWPNRTLTLGLSDFSDQTVTVELPEAAGRV